MDKVKKIFKKNIFIMPYIGLVALLFLLGFNLKVAFADGMIMDPLSYILAMPAQQAVVVWDKYEKKETLILNTSFGIDSLSRFCWIVPIISSQKPNVQESDNDILDYLKDQFLYTKVIYPSGSYSNSGYGGSVGGAQTIEVVEILQIDVYDLTILLATDSDDLTQWLKDNDYQVPSESEFADKVKVYTDEPGGCYFIFNKIDLKNKFADPLTELEAYGSDIYNDLMGENPNYHSIISDLVELLVNQINDGDLNHFMESLLDQEDYEDYEGLKDKYSNGEITRTNLEAALTNFLSSSGLFTTIYNLLYDAGTPIKVTFYPGEEPTYPLYITSLAENYGRIRVYVIFPNMVKDKNGVLRRYGSLKLTSSHKSKFEELEVDTPGCNYITLLSYSGYLDELTNDAIFVKYTPPSKKEYTTPYITPYITPLSPIIWNQPTWNQPIWNQYTWNQPIWNQYTWNQSIWSQSILNQPLWNQYTWNQYTWNQPIWNQYTWNQSIWSQPIWNQP